MRDINMWTRPGSIPDPLFWPGWLRDHLTHTGGMKGSLILTFHHVVKYRRPHLESTALE
jgi:hypothetical protein